ncbi:deoxyribodipyrimidine photo-lyase [Halanaerobacter jeridensis]|uniref:Deoxyribodipyrimidine photo-lyase n=1 Tax=Halanaerobacter jeridensis TaxID=706427 RepID=A0A938XQ01_9FIRM|nr:deoxyribodipyrimidine photo-lyase [Halanaerobacter jeridensis]MBM7555286.1 deoxyribodipyrimidine photo-lyase [Halanaerobacter jeridensis]
MKKSRIKSLNQQSLQNGEYILYWMQASQRVANNHALELAIEKANNLKQPLVVFFGLTANFPEANARHYYFMLEGLQEVQKKLKKRNIKMIIRHISPPEGIKELAEQASLVVTDRGYLKVEKDWKAKATQEIPCPLLQVESDVVVPVEEASDKEEYAAYTLRKKINKKLDDYLNPIETNQIQVSSLDFKMEGLNLDNLEQIINDLNIDETVNKSPGFTGGNSEAQKYLQDFLSNKLDKYEELSNDPTTDYLSHLGPYLHFGQISPLHVVLTAKKYQDSSGLEDFLDQIIVRRELSINFVYYNQNYDGQLKEILSEWAYETLQEHKNDLREYNYSREEFETAKTHDPYWNAAQLEMIATGKMHGYMRMYWGKKILEWTDDPQTAYDIALYLNNKYSLDGRDPNSYAGIAWCFGKHDRAWQERDVFGKVRYMNANGLNRKFDADLYVNQVAKLCNKHNLEHNLPTGLL